MGKIFANYSSNRISWINKEPQSTGTQENKPIQKWDIQPSKELSKDEMQRAEKQRNV